jgi:hypothetical protein
VDFLSFQVQLEHCKKSNDLKNQVYKLTGVPPQFQKIFGFPGGPLKVETFAGILIHWSA